jgi:hypothetical protein
VAVTRLTSFALVTTTAWRDSFDTFSGLDFTRFQNASVGGQVTQRRLVLSTTPGNGLAVSQPITPSFGFGGWGILTFGHEAAPPTTTAAVDILTLDGALIAADVASGADLGPLLDNGGYPSIRLRASLSSTESGQTPAILDWQVSWRVAPPQTASFVPLVARSQN